MVNDREVAFYGHKKTRSTKDSNNNSYEQEKASAFTESRKRGSQDITLVDRWRKDALNMADQILLKAGVKTPEDKPGNGDNGDENREDGSDEVEGKSCCKGHDPVVIEFGPKFLCRFDMFCGHLFGSRRLLLLSLCVRCFRLGCHH